jgi:hypothetical protein
MPGPIFDTLRLPIRGPPGGTKPSPSSPPASQIAAQHVPGNPALNPRMPAPLTAPVIARGQQRQGVDQVILQTGTGALPIPGSQYNMSNAQDIIGLSLVMSATITTPSGAWDMANAINRIEISDRFGRLKASIPGGTFLYDAYTRFTATKPTAVRANTIGTAATTGTAVIQLPGLRLPAKLGPWQIVIWYNTVAGTGSAAAAITVTNQINAVFGSANGMISRWRYQTFNLAGAAGGSDNLLQTQSVPQQVPIYEVFFRNFGNVTHLNFVQIESGTTVVESSLFESSIAQRDIDLDYGAYEATTLVLREPGPFIMDATGVFNVNLTTAEPALQIVWYFTEPA